MRGHQTLFQRAPEVYSELGNRSSGPVFSVLALGKPGGQKLVRRWKGAGKIANPVGFSKSLGVPQSSSGRVRRGSWPPPGRPARISGDKIPSHDNTVPDLAQGPLEPLAIERPDAPVIPVAPPVHEWLADLQIQGRSNQTIDWYRRRMNGYLGGGGARTLDRLTGSELKRCATWYETTGGSGWSTAG